MTNMKRLLPLLVFLAFLIPHSTNATVYFIDLSTTTPADTINSGLSTTSAWGSINKFTDNARVAGDIAFVRRGSASTTGIVAATFTSDGLLNAPITISADYDNLWGGFASTSESYVPAFGSTFIPSSASSTLVATSTWIYIGNDCSERAFGFASTTNPCEFAYEVKTASSTGIQLYLPYKGNQSGTTRNVRVMGNAPQVGTATEAVQIFTMSGDDYWYFKGLDLRSTNAGCVVNLGATNRGTIFYDMTVQGNGAGDCGVTGGAAGDGEYYKKIRMFNFVNGFGSFTVQSGGDMNDFFLDCNAVSNSAFFTIGNGTAAGFGNIKDGSIQNCTNSINSLSVGGRIKMTNVNRPVSYSSLSGFGMYRLYFSDDMGIINLSSQSSNQISANTISTTSISDTSQLRAGGGPENFEILPPSGTGNTGISVNYFPNSYMKLFEYPIYAVANVSKIYSMFFMSTSTTNFRVNPLTAASSTSATPEMYIECEEYFDAFDAARKLVRSSTASAINFTGSTAWQSISVTCTPTRSGILYLRGWYAKPNDGGSNWFFMDTTPVIS